MKRPQTYPEPHLRQISTESYNRYDRDQNGKLVRSMYRRGRQLSEEKAQFQTSKARKSVS